MSKHSGWMLVLACVGTLLTGCREAQPGCTASTAPCSGTGSLEHGGRTRTFRYHLPPGTGPGLPLVLSLHGRLGQGEDQQEQSGFNAIADEARFIVVYPDGVDRSWADGRGTTPADVAGVDDVGFLTALIDHFIERHGADTRRVYSAGMSNGGMMSYRLACEVPERIAAIAPVAALMSQPLAIRCTPARPVPLVVFAGTQDTLMPYQGGETSGDRGAILSASEVRSRWATWNGCPAGAPASAQLEDVDPADGTRVRSETHSECREGSEVVLFTIEGGGHTWPGGPQLVRESIVGRTSQDLDASRTAWRFLQRFERR